MDVTDASLHPILILLAAAVLAVVACRFLELPPVIGYLVVGLALGPRALGIVPDDAQTRHRAEFGVVFLMFSIGLEFSLSKLRVMRREVFRLGAAQVMISIAGCVAVALVIAGGTGWQAGLAIGGVVAMSSTAVRDEQYGLLRGLFHGASDDAESVEAAQPRLQAVTLTGNAPAVGKTLAEIGLLQG